MYTIKIIVASIKCSVASNTCFVGQLSFSSSLSISKRNFGDTLVHVQYSSRRISRSSVKKWNICELTHSLLIGTILVIISHLAWIQRNSASHPVSGFFLSANGFFKEKYTAFNIYIYSHTRSLYSKHANSSDRLWLQIYGKGWYRKALFAPQ